MIDVTVFPCIWKYKYSFKGSEHVGDLEVAFAKISVTQMCRVNSIVRNDLLNQFLLNRIILLSRIYFLVTFSNSFFPSSLASDETLSEWSISGNESVM